MFPARTTAYFLSVAALCLGALSILGLLQIRSANEENSLVRIDRAGRAAAALMEQRDDVAAIQRSADGFPTQIQVNSAASLLPGTSWEALLDAVSTVNQGAANLFRFNVDTTSFDRIGTTFRTPDGSRVGGSEIEPGLITVGHPAFESLEGGERYVGEVPVAGRLRLAYLIPIVETDGSLAGILAVDVGWVDDLNRINGNAARQAIIAAALLLGVLAIICVGVMFVSFRPLTRLTDLAHALGSTEGVHSLSLTDRRDEIGYLANGLVKVADLQHTLRHQAFTDDLTGIANRAALIRELERRIDEIDEIDNINPGTSGRGFELFIIDLDGFKEINDGLGHRAGDEVLTAFSLALQEHVEPGEFIARHGGDEFALVSAVRRSDQNVATRIDAITARIHNSVAAASAGSTQKRLTASIGIVAIPRDAKDSAEAISHADLALYEVKNTERGAAQLYDPALSGVFKRRLYLTDELQQALQTGSLHVAYQPLYGLGGRMRAVEALARWTHPVEGPIPPSEFIPIAENLGLIGQLGSFILDESCRQVAEWSATNASVPSVSVNISSVQIADPRFTEMVWGSLQRHGLAADQICLELTESVLLPGRDSAQRKVLTALSRLGVSLSIDDFGTGYSSLGYLHELTVDQVKIDRSFISAATDTPKQARILSSIIALGKSLGLSVVLEGVETDSELALARSTGCDLLQGFALARPLSPQDVEPLFAGRHALLSDTTSSKPALEGDRTHTAVHGN